eukprot:537157_1
MAHEQYTKTDQNEMATVGSEDNDTDTHENNSLLPQHDQKRSCNCYKRWNSTQFTLYSVIIVLSSAVIVGILSNIDRIIQTDSSQSIDLSEYCVLGVFSPPSDYTPPTLPIDWIFSYQDNIFNGPSVWHKYFPQCACESGQSPRNIDTTHSQLNTPQQFCSDNSSLLQWKIDSNYTIAYNGTFEVFHNEHTIQMKNINYLNDSLIPIGMLKNLWQPINSSLHSEFRLEQIHFHWGNNEHGSSHTINGKNYPLTIHFVHYSADYNSLDEAYMDWKSLYAANKDRYVLAVVGIFFEIDKTNSSQNDAIDQLLSSEVLNSPDSDHGFVERINLTDFLPHDIESYYYYQGSLSTPPCDPIVRMMILANPLKVNENQIEKFKSIANETVTYNSRPIQINTNPVYACHSQFF